MTAEIDVLMPVYNASRYLDEALESVAVQEFDNWCIILRDDGSSDDTLDVVERWRTRLGDKIRVIDNPERINLGIFGNTARLLAESRAPYVCALAHDDRYHPSRLRLGHERMTAIEGRKGAGHPVLIYSDLSIIDDRSNLVARSYWSHTGWRPPGKRPLGTLLVHSGVIGATFLANRPALALLRGHSFADDTGFTRLMAVLGDLVPIMEPTCDYRWHDGNSIYSHKISFVSTVRDVLAAPFAARRLLLGRLDAVRPLSIDFLAKFGDAIPAQDAETVRAFIDLPTMGPVERRRALFRHGIRYPSLIRTLGLYLLI